MNTQAFSSILIEDLSRKYTPQEVLQIVVFLIPFVSDGRVAAVRIFERSALFKPEKRPTFPQIMTLFKEREATWRANPDRVGDPDDTTSVDVDGQTQTLGMNNTSAYFAIYRDLGFKPLPKMLF
ncbi:MAG: hypothetical protein V4467_00975 [Patescibacteria group bacterium]